MFHSEVVVSLDGFHTRLTASGVNMSKIIRFGEQLIVAIAPELPAPDAAVEMIVVEVRTRLFEFESAEGLPLQEFILLDGELQEIIRPKVTRHGLFHRI